MGARGQRNNPCIVNHLQLDDHISRNLHNLKVVVVSPREHRRAFLRQDDAALSQRPVFGPVELVSAIARSPVSRSLFARGCQGGNLSVWWVVDQ